MDTEKAHQERKESLEIDMKKIKYFDALLDSSVVSTSDLEGNITSINENFTKVTGYIQEEVLGKNHNILRHSETSQELYEDLWDTIKRGEVWRERILNRNKDGSDFWASTTIIPLKDEKTKKNIEYIAIRRDITDFLLMQRQLHRQRMQKEQQKKISQAKDSFLLLFSHELKTPLNAIINFTKYLLKHVNAATINNIPLEKRKTLLTQIELSASKMLQDVTQLLELNRHNADKLYYNYTIVELNDLVKEVINDHGALAKENNTEISFTSKCRSCFASSDLYRLKQIMANVLSNAIKYGEGEVNISVECNDIQSIIAFEDNGPSIEDKEKIFELFEQVSDNIKTREQQGTGIGLYFSKLLCKDLKIDYKLEDSKDLGGLKFILYISLRRQEHD